MYQFYLADDHPLYRDALQLLLQQHWPTGHLQQAANLDELFQLLAVDAEPDLILLDVNMPGSDGLSGLTQLKQRYPYVPVAMLSAADDKHTVLQAMALGAIGFISKSADKQHLLDALTHILAGHIYLPAQSFQAKDFQAKGFQTPETLPPQVLSNTSSVLSIDNLLQLTRQQRRVLAKLLEGASNKQIAETLFIAPTTVKAHVTAIFNKLGVQSRTQLLAQAAQTDTLKRLSL